MIEMGMGRSATEVETFGLQPLSRDWRRYKSLIQKRK